MKTRVSGILLLAAIVTPVLLALPGCGRKPQVSESKPSGEEYLGIDKDTTAEERAYLLAAKPFMVALANGNYGEVYAQLSSHGRARMSLNQFSPSLDEAVYKQQEDAALTGVSLEKFVELMGLVEKTHGKPTKPKQLSVQSTDAAVLNRSSKEQFGAMDSMLAIGAMPESIPAAIRKASLRGQIQTTLTAEKMAQIAKEQGVTVEELKKDEDFEPYFNFKIVLVEEEAKLKVAYFEFLPPSMMD